MARQIQVSKRNVPIEQIIAVQGQNPVASGIDTAGKLLGQAILRKAELQQQGQQLAKLEALSGQQPGAFQGLDPSTAADLTNKYVSKQMETQATGTGNYGRGGASGYFVPRGVDPVTGRPIYSNSKRPGLFFDDMTPYQGTAPGKLTLQTLPSEQIEQESKMDTLSLAFDKVKNSYSDEFVGPVASTVGKAKQYVEPLANEQAANFYSNLADMRNQIVYLRSGKQINEEEYKRLLNAIPNERTSPTDFKVRLANFEQLKDTILASRQKNLTGAGYRTAGGLQPLQPPKRQPITPSKIGRFQIEVE